MDSRPGPVLQDPCIKYVSGPPLSRILPRTLEGCGGVCLRGGSVSYHLFNNDLRRLTGDPWIPIGGSVDVHGSPLGTRTKGATEGGRDEKEKVVYKQQRQHSATVPMSVGVSTPRFNLNFGEIFSSGVLCRRRILGPGRPLV